MKRFISWLAHAASPANRNRPFNIILIFLLFLLPLLILALFNYAQTRRSLTELSLSRRQAIVVPVMIALQERLDRLVELGISFSIHPKIRENIAKGKWDEAAQIFQIFKDVTDEPFVDRIFLTDPQGTETAAVPELVGGVGRNFAFRDWYKGITGTSKPYVSEVYRRAAEPQYNVVAIAIPVLDDKGLFMAIMVLQIRLDRFLEWSKDIDVGPEGFVYIVDQRGHVVTHPKFSPQEKIVDFSDVSTVQKVMKGKRGSEITYNSVEKENVVLAYEPVLKYGWGVIVQQPTKSAFTARDSSLRFLLFVFSLIFLFGIFLIYLILQTIAHYQDHHD